MPDNPMVCLCQFVLRKADNSLVWVGLPGALAAAVARCNAKEATEVDWLALSAFPIFDENDIETVAMGAAIKMEVL
jgi:hypothetical protein